MKSVCCLAPKNNDKNNSLFKPSTCSSPMPNTFSINDNSLRSILDCISPSSSIKSALNQNMFSPIRSSPIRGTKLMKNTAVSMSPTFDKHLYFPTPSTSKQPKTKTKAPRAISSLAWREHIQAKENAKIEKAEAVKARKQEHQKTKMEKENKAPKVKNRHKKQKQVCGTCNQDLDTNAEGELLKNVGCHTCPQWFHLKCTALRDLTFDEVILMDFICETCKLKKD